MDGAGSISDKDSESASSQGPASSVSLIPSAPLSDAALGDVGVSCINLGDVRLYDLGLNDLGLNDLELSDVDLSNMDMASPLPDTTALLDGSASAASSESKKSVERTAFDCLLGEPNSIDAMPLPERRSVCKEGRHTEISASDVTARRASDEDTRQPPRYDPSAGVEEFKWSGLPNNNIG